MKIEIELFKYILSGNILTAIPNFYSEGSVMKRVLDE